jgi:hypothetical protein
MEVLDKDGSNLAQSKHVVVACAIVDFPEENEEPDFEQLQQLHHNAQASLVLLSSLEKDEFSQWS